jgi:outer membrane protein
MNRRHIIALGAAALAILAPAAPAAAADLLAIYRLAEQHDPAWAAARATHRADVEQGPQGRALLLPSVVAGANTNRIDQERTAPDLVTGTTTTSKTRYDNTGYNVQLTQPLYRKQSFAAYQQGKIAVSQADAELVIARQDLMLRAARAYFDVLAAEDRLSFARSEKAAIAGQLELAERNFAVGNATIVDVHEARARYDLANAEEVAAANNLEVRREALLALVREPPGALAPLRRLTLGEPEPPDMARWVEAAEDQSPRLRISEYRLEIAREEIARSRGGHYPTLDLVASHNYSDQGGSAFGFASESTSNQVGVQLQLPLYAGGATQSTVRESVAREDAARQTLEQTRRDVVRQTREFYLAVASGAARVQALEQARVSTRKALESTLLGYETGVRTAVDVLNAQRDLFRTERDLSQARYDYLISRLQLKNAVGTLGEDDLAEINASLGGE